MKDLLKEAFQDREADDLASQAHIIETFFSTTKGGKPEEKKPRAWIRSASLVVAAALALSAIFIILYIKNVYFTVKLPDENVYFIKYGIARSSFFWSALFLLKGGSQWLRSQVGASTETIVHK